jgi:hypothetical protein
MILPLDAAAREAILAIAEDFEAHLSELQRRVAHLPSRVRSLLWVACAVPVLRKMGESMPDRDRAVEALVASLPGLLPGERQALRRAFAEAALRRAI